MAHSPSQEGLEIATPMLCQELWGGGFLVSPVADHTLACQGETLAGCLAEQRLLLEEVLATAEPRVVARYSLPKGVKLLDLEVKAPRPDLPKRLAFEAPIELTCVLVPFAQESWAFLPALSHAVRIEAKADPLQVVKADAERFIAALEMAPEAWLRLLPPRAQSIEWLNLKLRRSDLDTPEKARAARKKAIKDKRAAEAAEILSSVAVALHERPEAKGVQALVGRDRELTELGALLSAKERSGIVLVGPELCGKTALLYAWLRRERAAGHPRQVWATSASRLIAGMSGLGQWQERVRRVVEAAGELDAVLYFENLADLLAQHASESLDVAGALKPALQEGKVRLVGEIAPESLGLLEARHAGFLSTLARFKVEPLDPRATVRVLNERVAALAKSDADHPNLDPAAVPRLVELVERYLPYRAFPGKAVRLLDELRAAHRGEREKGGGPRRLDDKDVYALFSVKTGVPQFLLREDRALLADEVKWSFSRQLVGQQDAVRRVVEALCEVKAGLQPTGKPLASFLFVGPTGVGKTELARQLATFLFGAPDRLFRFDMSEFADPWAAARLFQGNEGAEGLLTRRVRQQPFCVLLLDEIEKAHPAVLDLLLQLLGEGRLSDARGRTAFFQNALVVLTSNLGASHRHLALGIGAATTDDARHYRRAVEHAFRPELVNRIDHIVPFAPLGPDEARKVTRIVIERLRERRGLGGSGATLAIDDALVEALAAEGYQPAYGARALRRCVEDRLVAPMALALSDSRAAGKGARLTARVEDGQIRVDIEVIADGAARGALTPVVAVQDQRRFADMLLSLEPVEQMREQISVIVAQLASSEGKGKNQRMEQLVAMKNLRGDHQRMDALLREAEELRGGLEAAEELALLAYFAQQDVEPFSLEAKDQHARLKSLGPYLLLGQEPRREEITLLLQEADDGRALDVWLGPLLVEAKARRWAVEARPGLTYDKPKRKRRWLPALPTGAFAAALEAGDRTFREVMLHVRGPHAGLFLALEAGLHRFHEIHPQVDPAHLLVETLAMRFTLSEQELEGGAVQPHPLLPAKQLTLMPAVRVRQADGKILIVVKERHLDASSAGYWKSFELVALEHLLHYELGKAGFDREGTYRSPVDAAKGREGVK